MFLMLYSKENLRNLLIDKSIREKYKNVLLAILDFYYNIANFITILYYFSLLFILSIYF